MTEQNGNSPIDPQAGDAAAFADQHPEVLVGAALLGGLVLAQVLKHLGED